MGRADCPPSIQHFSHPHPLELQVAMNIIVSCSGCKLNASNTFYTCKTCNYTLHVSCSKLPQQITHPADPNHTLSLLPVPAYEGGFFNCDACGKSGNGFSYHCKACNKDIHTLCAIRPLSINHQSHPHPLTLTFSPPYLNKGFSCDICHQVGLNHWLYRCNLCEFDAHLGCASTRPQPHPQTQIRTQTQTRPINQQTVQRSAVPQFVPSYVPSNMNNPNQGVPGVAVPNQRIVQQGNGFFRNQSPRAAYIPSNMNNPNQVGFGAAGPNQRGVQGNGIFRNLNQSAAYMPSNMNNSNRVVFGAGGPNQRNGQQSNSIFNNILQSAATGAAQQFGKSVVQDIMGGGGHGSGGGGLFGGGGGATDFGGSLNGGLDLGGGGGGGGATDFGGILNGGLDFGGGAFDFGGDFSSNFVDFGGFGDFSGNC